MSGNMTQPYNEGHPGYRIDQISAVIPSAASVLTGDIVPNLILLHAGTNDCFLNYDTAAAHVRLGSLIDQVLAAWPRSSIIVAKVIAGTAPFVASVQSSIQAYDLHVEGQWPIAVFRSMPY